MLKAAQTKQVKIMKAEKGITIAFIVGLVFKYLHWPGGSQILIISLSILAIIYCFGAIYFFSDKTIKNQNLLLTIFSGFFLAFIPIGVLFKLQYWPGADFSLLLGIFLAIIIFSITYFLKSKSKDELETYYKNMTIRITTLITLAALLYLTPTATLVKLQYWNDPELARLKTLKYTNPGNEDYIRQHDEYIMKRDSLYLKEKVNEKK